MTTNIMGQYHWSYLLPEITILAFATLLSLIDLFMGKRTSRAVLGWLAVVGVVLAGFFVISNVNALDKPYTFMADMLRIDDYGNVFKLLFLSGVAFTLILSQSYLKKGDITHQGEYYYLLLTGLLGAMVMASSADLITLFVGLELLSISSYVLVGLRKTNLRSNEASFKYVVSGGIATAVTLFGMSYLYGMTGTTNLYEMTERIAAAYMNGFSFLVILSFAMMLVGLGFKIATVPNHMWAPDVYQGAPTPVTAFLAVVSKAAGFALVFRLLLIAFYGVIAQNENVTLCLSFVAGLSMIIGNTMAIRQTNVKRMMAYSGIAQAGYLLVPFISVTYFFFEQVTFYLFAYLLMSFGAFAIIMVVTRDQGSEELKSFSGLYHRAPFLAIAMTIFLLSLAGIPISAGFFGKFYIFLSSVALKHYWLSAVMIATSVVSYYYYFGIIRQMYMRPGQTEAPLKAPMGVVFVVGITLIATLAFGIVPEVATNYLHTTFNAHFDFGNMVVPSK
ncbi:NADH-quinone oxidoreductase subunit NuoN [Brevibacillus ginsengisoli]|uniref:NADH-quinone oxidoreductase subunit NuoN n=1 Tax=Brevibacillus ginsengisoli TaxID=363854 RepID=UPI003CF9B17D